VTFNFRDKLSSEKNLHEMYLIYGTYDFIFGKVVQFAFCDRLLSFRIRSKFMT